MIMTKMANVAMPNRKKTKSIIWSSSNVFNVTSSMLSDPEYPPECCKYLYQIIPER
jgi:hypothetical protein